MPLIHQDVGHLGGVRAVFGRVRGGIRGDDTPYVKIIQWRHYFGPDGPRPPPTLFIGPACTVPPLPTIMKDR